MSINSIIVTSIYTNTDIYSATVLVFWLHLSITAQSPFFCYSIHHHSYSHLHLEGVYKSMFSVDAWAWNMGLLDFYWTQFIWWLHREKFIYSGRRGFITDIDQSNGTLWVICSPIIQNCESAVDVIICNAAYKLWGVQIASLITSASFHNWLV